FLGHRVNPSFARHDWVPGSLVTTALIVFGWAALIWGNSIKTIWPMFGVANQLLASVALCVASAMIANAGRRRYLWVTLLPLAFVSVTPLRGGYMSIRDISLPLTESADTAGQGWLNSSLTALLMVCVVIVLLDTFRHLTAAKQPSTAHAGA